MTYPCGPSTVLVIDREHALREFVATLLDAEGYVVATAADIDEVPALLADLPPRLVVIDNAQWGVAPPDVLDLLAALRLPPSIPVLICSSSGREEAEDCVLPAGRADLIRKPFSVDLFLATVARLIRVRPD